MKKILSVLFVFMIGFSALASVTSVPAQAATLSSQAGKVVTASGRLNVRSGESTASSVIASLSKGSHVTLISKSGSWWRVEYDKGKYGYVHADYIAVVSSEPATVKLSSGYLNVRSGASASNTAIGRLSSGDVVLVLSTSGNWSRVLWHGVKTGYVSNTYLSKGAPAYAAVSLKLPYYKQTDSRWANATLGSSGKTIAKSGCVTTAIAMMESYRANKTIYPDAMSKQLKYTSGGDVYWPSDYQPVFTNSLAEIYKLLKQGKPVLYGSRNAYSSQHWVVITGYTGGSTLTASGFTIHDPGYSQRTNLQQHLNSFPNFYKYFYYK